MLLKQSFAVCLVLAITASPLPGMAADSDPAVVLEWNRVLQQTAAVGAAGPLQSRSYAMVHIAMFDAANSIARRYTPFHASFAASSGASPEAAAAQAAHDVMAGLFGPSASFDATLQARLATIDPGRAMQGIAIGKAAAQHVLEWRQNDGAFGPASVFAPPLLPGLWQPTVPGANAGLTQVPRATPFAMLSATQFMVGRHPEINSAKYAEDFDEVKSIGAVASIARTAYQTETALLWAGVITSTNLFQVWNTVMVDTVSMQRLSLLEAARGFAVMNAALFDAIMTSQTGKFTYALWRPWDAIHRAADDANAATDPDATWQPLLPTPPYPTYPGNMACIGATAARALANVAGTDAVHFSATWKGLPPHDDYTRSYDGYWQMAQEEADSRIYGGIHFRFDNVASQAQCVKVADWVDARVRRLR